MGHGSLVSSLRDELALLRTHGGISEQFADWHRRLVVCLRAITSDIPSCASLCEELIAINFELPPEFAAGVPEGLADHRIISAAYQAYFRNKCDHADEVMNTLLLVLRHLKK